MHLKQTVRSWRLVGLCASALSFRHRRNQQLRKALIYIIQKIVDTWIRNCFQCWYTYTRAEEEEESYLYWRHLNLTTCTCLYSVVYTPSIIIKRKRHIMIAYSLPIQQCHTPPSFRKHLPHRIVATVTASRYVSNRTLAQTSSWLHLN